MNLENNEEFVRTLKDKVESKVVDGKTYLSVDSLDFMLDNMAIVVIKAAANGEVCGHSYTMAQYIIGNLANVTDTLNAIHASEMVPDTIPDDIL